MAARLCSIERTRTWCVATGKGKHMHIPSTEAKLRPPSLVLLALEGTRAAWEFGATLASLPILHSAPRGDGHSVLIFPGLVASDLSTEPLRRYLQAQGYRAHEWGLGRNLGPRPGVLDACRDRIKKLRRESGRKVSLIGWSLGGVYAREMAKEVPEDVRCVITLGTPFRGSPRATNAWRVYEITSGETIDTVNREQIERSPPVPTTSIFSRTDGVVAWQCSGRRPRRFPPARPRSPPGSAASSAGRARSRIWRWRRAISASASIPRF